MQVASIRIRSENFSTPLYFLAADKETRLAPLWPDLQRFEHGTITVLLQHQTGARPLIRQRIPQATVFCNLFRRFVVFGSLCQGTMDSRSRCLLFVRR